MNKQHSVVSIDFWNTIVKAETNGEVRQRVRMEALQFIARKYRTDITPEIIKKVQSDVNADYDKMWLEEHRTPSTSELLTALFRRLNIQPTRQEMRDLAKIVQESIYDGPPDLADHIKEVIPELAQHYPLAIISDTMYSPGRILREYLRERDLIQYFDLCVFSDETGYSKPNVKAFKKVLEHTNAQAENSYHIGDIHLTDIIGAQNAGMKSILYTGVSETFKDTSDADYITDNWLDIQTLLLNS